MDARCGFFVEEVGAELVAGFVFGLAGCGGVYGDGGGRQAALHIHGGGAEFAATLQDEDEGFLRVNRSVRSRVFDSVEGEPAALNLYGGGEAMVSDDLDVCRL